MRRTPASGSSSRYRCVSPWMSSTRLGKRRPSSCRRSRSGAKPSRGAVVNGFACMSTTSPCASAASTAASSSQANTACMRPACSGCRRLLSRPGTFSATNTQPPACQRTCSQNSPAWRCTFSVGAQKSERHTARRSRGRGNRSTRCRRAAEETDGGYARTAPCAPAARRRRSACSGVLEPMSPTWTTNASRSAFISSITRIQALDLGLAVGRVAQHAEHHCAAVLGRAGCTAHPESTKTRNRDRPHFPQLETSLDAVGLAQQGERMRLLGAPPAPRPCPAGCGARRSGSRS